MLRYSGYGSSASGDLVVSCDADNNEPVDDKFLRKIAHLVPFFPCSLIPLWDYRGENWQSKMTFAASVKRSKIELLGLAMTHAVSELPSRELYGTHAK